MKIKTFIKKFTSYSLPSKIGFLSFIITIIVALIFNIGPVIIFFINKLDNKISDRQNDAHFAQTLLSIVYNRPNETNRLIDKYFKKNNLAYKKDILFWYGQRNYGQKSYLNSNKRLEQLLKNNPELTDSDTLHKCVINGLNNLVYQAKLDETANYMSKYPEIIKELNIPELLYIKELNADEDTCIKAFLENTWNISNERFLRLIENNILTGVFNKYDNTLIQCITLGLQNELFPQSFSNSFLTIHMEIGNLRLMNNDQRIGFNMQLAIAYKMLDEYKQTSNYLYFKNILDKLSKMTGYIDKKCIQNTAVLKTLLQCTDENEVILNYDYYVQKDIVYIALFKGKLWNVNNVNESIMKPFFQNSYFELLSIKDNVITKLTANNNYGTTLHFIQIIARPPLGFFIITSDGTYEGKNITFYGIDGNNLTSKSLYDFNSNMDYHSSAYYTFLKDDFQYFSWNYEYDNKIQPNISRKIAVLYNLSYNPEKDTLKSIKKDVNEVFDFIENTYIEDTKLQLKLMDTIAINGEIIKDKNLIKIMSNPTEYYSSNIINNTLLWIPKEYQPLNSIFIFENRNLALERNNDDIEEYIFLIKNEKGKYSIKNIYISINGQIEKTLIKY